MLRLDQPRGAPGARTRYRVFDGHGTFLATAGERDIPRLRKAARVPPEEAVEAAVEMLTTADRYSVEIFQPLDDPLRVLVAVTAIGIDLMLYEGKDWPIG